jgi:hypothetical protein
MEIELLIVSVILGLVTIFFVATFAGTSFFMEKSNTMPVGTYPKLVLGEGFVGAETKALNHRKIVAKAKEGFYGGAANGAGETETDGTARSMGFSMGFDQEIDGNTPFSHIAGAGIASLKLNLFF